MPICGVVAFRWQCRRSASSEPGQSQVNKSRTSSDPQGPSTAQEIVALDDPLAQPHAADVDDLLVALNTTRHGLSGGEAKDRLQRFGPNALPHTAPAGFGALFIRQFSSPLIYVLLFAAAVSLVIREWSDAVLIAAVLLVNAVIGTLQEFSAQRAAEALNKLVTTQSRRSPRSSWSGFKPGLHSQAQSRWRRVWNCRERTQYTAVPGRSRNGLLSSLLG
jgi:magnesium-transporting ATPase (P-type)